jgi:NAD(P)H-hydrate repair Nnr-like enzyme with NAD(P)H-hydrate dehydratase domain
MEDFASGAMALAMLAALLLGAGGVKLVVNRPTRVRGILMIAAAAVLITNVMIWTV